MNVGIKRFVLLMGVSFLPLMSMPVYAADGYTPPNLFGVAPAPVVVAKPEPEIIAPQIKKQAAVVEQPVVPVSPPVSTPTNLTAAPIDDASTSALDEAASATERVQNPVQTHAPLGTDELLNYPADRVAENAQAALKAAEDAAEKNQAVPELIPYDDDTATTAPGADKGKNTSLKRASTKPVIAKVKSIPKGEAPAERPKVAVYGRDAKTGEFKRTDLDDKFVKVHRNPAETAQADLEARALAKAAEQARKNAIARRLDMPAVPPPAVESRNLLSAVEDEGSGAIAAGIPPLEDDMSSQLLAAGDTAKIAPDAVAPPLPNLAQARAAMTNEVDSNTNDVAPAAGSTAPVLGDQHVLLVFKTGLSDLNEELRGRLGENVVPRLNADKNLRVSIQAYAAPSDDTPNGDRRLSLARALAVREYLRSQGIETSRMDVRAMGKNTTRPPFDRVDVIFMADK